MEGWSKEQKKLYHGLSSESKIREKEEKERPRKAPLQKEEERGLHKDSMAQETLTTSQRAIIIKKQEGG